MWALLTNTGYTSNTLRALESLCSSREPLLSLRSLRTNTQRALKTLNAFVTLISLWADL